MINNYVQLDGRSFLTPFKDCGRNYGKVFSAKARDLKFDENSGRVTPHTLSVGRRIGHFMAAFVLMPPLINIVSAKILKRISTHHHQFPAKMHYSKNSGRLHHPVSGLNKTLPNGKCAKRAPLEKIPSKKASPREVVFGTQQNHCGAGVLPYYIAADGTAYFLLGKEAMGKSAGQWADFGGARDPGETCGDTAARECFEETKGILGTTSSLKSRITATPPLYNGSAKFPYYMFLHRVHNPHAITNKKFKATKISGQHQDEKSAICWVKAQDLFQGALHPERIKGQRGTYKVSNVLLDGQKQPIRGAFAMALQKMVATEADRLFLRQLLGSCNVPAKG